MGLINTESVTVTTPVVDFDSLGEPIERGSVNTAIEGVIVRPGGHVGTRRIAPRWH